MREEQNKMSVVTNLFFRNEPFFIAGRQERKQKNFSINPSTSREMVDKPGGPSEGSNTNLGECVPDVTACLANTW